MFQIVRQRVLDRAIPDRAINEHFIELAHELVFQLIPQKAHALLSSCISRWLSRRLPQSHDPDVQSSRAHSTLVPAAVHLRGKLHGAVRRRTYSAPTPFGPYSYVRWRKKINAVLTT